MARQTKKSKKQEAKKDRPVMWSDVTGVMRVYGAEFTTKNNKSFIKYSTSIGRKNEKGEYDNCYLPVFFAKDDDPGIDGAIEIIVTKGFLTLNVYDKGNGKNAVHVVEPAIMVQDYEFIDDEQEDDEDKPF